ncbi:MAG: response regulator transcription factor [Candidatus Melainabacteria bacterium]|nr:response regulator transcription factor [Candidatus Melainabacteria bacterium]
MIEDESKKIKLMLVEDHVLTRIGLKVSLEKYSNLEIVAETANGREAVELAKEKAPDLIIMDIGLIELDGIETTKRIKQANPNIKVIMLTSHESEREILASLASGADGYCLKDTAPDQLYTAIGSVHEGNAWLSSQVAEKVLRNLCGKDINQIKQIDFSKKVENIQQKDPTRSTCYIPTIPLSERELEVLKLIVDGKSNQDIASKLFVTLATVKTHVRSILNKLSVDDRTQAAVKAMREGLVKF